MAEQANSEKRRFKRVPVSFAMLYAVKLPFVVRMISGNRERSAVSQDIGEGGMGLLMNFEIPADSLLLLKFTLTNYAIISEDSTRNFQLDAQVCYCEAAENQAYRLGVSFLNILPSECRFIANYIKSNALVKLGG